MQRLLIALVVALIPVLAMAQDTAPSYKDYSAAGFGFSIKLPATGAVQNPQSEGWSEDPEVAFIWQGDGTEPVLMVLGRVDPFGTKVDAGGFKAFCDALLENWKSNPSTVLLTENKAYDAYGLKWNVIEAQDKGQEGERPIFYSVFSTYSGEGIYTFAFYYDHQPNEATQKFGAPVLQGFKAGS